MSNEKKLNNLRLLLLVVCIPMCILEIAVISICFKKKTMKPYFLWLVIDTSFGLLLAKKYYQKVSYVCPDCGEVFKPSFEDMVFSKHTLNTRQLICPKCWKLKYCKEVYNEES